MIFFSSSGKLSPATVQETVFPTINQEQKCDCQQRFLTHTPHMVSKVIFGLQLNVPRLFTQLQIPHKHIFNRTTCIYCEHFCFLLRAGKLQTPIRQRSCSPAGKVKQETTEDFGSLPLPLSLPPSACEFSICGAQ